MKKLLAFIVLLVTVMMTINPQPVFADPDGGGGGSGHNQCSGTGC